mmetsp:Transcript_35120/g.81252  ORF Transcript_35120/g.81252 Transcript_35120/m.81252 type:complete len:289 (-) Transcript_35120:460-1326(-)
MACADSRSTGPIVTCAPADTLAGGEWRQPVGERLCAAAWDRLLARICRRGVPSALADTPNDCGTACAFAGRAATEPSPRRSGSVCAPASTVSAASAVSAASSVSFVSEPSLHAPVDSSMPSTSRSSARSTGSMARSICSLLRAGIASYRPCTILCQRPSPAVQNRGSNSSLHSSNGRLTATSRSVPSSIALRSVGGARSKACATKAALSPSSKPDSNSARSAATRVPVSAASSLTALPAAGRSSPPSVPPPLGAARGTPRTEVRPSDEGPRAATAGGLPCADAASPST